MTVTFEIDTGTNPTGARQYVPDWLQDQCPDTYTDAQVVQAYAHHIIGSIGEPKKQDTARKHILMNWAFIRALADEIPGLFDEVWTAYSERLLSLD